LIIASILNEWIWWLSFVCPLSALLMFASALWLSSIVASSKWLSLELWLLLKTMSYARQPLLIWRFLFIFLLYFYCVFFLFILSRKYCDHLPAWGRLLKYKKLGSLLLSQYWSIRQIFAHLYLTLSFNLYISNSIDSNTKFLKIFSHFTPISWFLKRYIWKGWNWRVNIIIKCHEYRDLTHPYKTGL
jgi:hypothetical protein